MSEWLKRLLNEDGINSIPSYIDQQKDTKQIAKVLGDKKIKEYIKRYQGNVFNDTLWLISPLDLLLAGHFLRIIRKTQSKFVFNRTVAKVSQANLNDNQVFDTLAELSVVAMVAVHYEIDLDKPTIPSGDRWKDADIYIPSEDVYIEVKNFNMWFSDHSQRLMRIVREHSTPDTQITINPKSKNKDHVEITGNEPSIQSVSDTKMRSGADQLKRMLKGAAKKFDGSQAAVLVMTNVMNPGTANKVVLDWFKSQKSPAIKYVAVTGPRHADDGKRDVHILELVKNDKIKSVLKAVFGEPDFINLKDVE